MIDRPEIVIEEHLTYLDDLRESGIVNMFGAGEFLRHEFDLSKKDSYTVLNYWMESFEERRAR